MYSNNFGCNLFLDLRFFKNLPISPITGWIWKMNNEIVQSVFSKNTNLLNFLNISCCLDNLKNKLKKRDGRN